MALTPRPATLQATQLAAPETIIGLTAADEVHPDVSGFTATRVTLDNEGTPITLTWSFALGDWWLDGRVIPAADMAATAYVGTEAANLDALTKQARNALAVNAAFLALASPTTVQAVAQVRALTRQVNALIRLATRALEAA